MVKQIRQCAVLFRSGLTPRATIATNGETAIPTKASFARVWRAQLAQIAIPFMGLPALTVSTGLVGRIPVGVQVVSGRFREDLCLLAGEAIEAGGTPPAPVDPVG